MDYFPITCSCSSGGKDDFLPMLVVVFVFLAASMLWRWFRTKHAKDGGTAKRARDLAIVAALVAAVAATFAVKQSRCVPKTEVAPAAVPAAHSLPRLVDLGANKCVSCKLMTSVLEDLKKTCAGKLAVEFIDVWENPGAGKQFGVQTIPTQIFFSADGKELFRNEGYFSREDILAKWKEFGVELAKPAGE